MVYVFLAQGFEEIEALTQVDLLRRAGLNVKTVSVGGTEKVKGSNGITVVPDISDSEVEYDKIDCVILPGGLGGVKNLKASQKVKDAVGYAYKNGKLVCAICAAPTILDTFGISGKKITCYPGMEDQIIGNVPAYSRNEKDGNVITGNAAGGSEEFALRIISELCGKDTAQNVRNKIFAR